MKLSFTRSIFALGVLFFGAIIPTTLLGAMSRGFNQLLDSVVRIDVREVTFEDGVRRFSAGIGSGVILSSDGIILTNAHVASPKAVEINVTLVNLANGSSRKGFERVDATLVGWDHWTDLAVLRLDMKEIERRGLKFSHGEFGRSDKLFPGETVYAVGTPYGLERTVSRGIISNTKRDYQDPRGVNGYETGYFNTWLQTDAAINPGNSGGPLVTEDGEVIGINSRAYIGADNLAFAIPSSTAEIVVNDLVKKGAVTRSYAGMMLQPLRDLEGFYSLAANTAVLISGVDAGSPAAKAGIRVSDILLAINGEKVDGRFPEQLPPIQSIVASQPVGASLRFTIKRGAETRDFTVVTEKLESRLGEEGAFEKWGLSVRKVSRSYARENQLPDDSGVIVIGIQSGYPADLAGLARGDIIMKINQKAIASLDAVKAAHAAYEAKPEPTLVEAQRSRRAALYILKP